MILPIGKWYDQTNDAYYDRFLIFGYTVKDAVYKTVGSKQTPMLTLTISTGREEELINIKMWSYNADKHRNIKKGRAIICDAYADSRVYQDKTYTDYIPLVFTTDGGSVGEPAAARTRKPKTVEPQSQADEEGFFDIVNKDDLPF